MNWYYADRDKPVGPLSEQEFQARVKSGEIKPQTLVWNEEMTDWQPFVKVKAPDVPLQPEPMIPPSTATTLKPMAAPTSTAPAPSPRASAVNSSSKTTSPEPGKVHEVLFSLLLLDGIFTLVDLFYNTVTITLVGTLLALTTGVCVVTALVRQYRGYMPCLLRAITWGSLGYVCFSFIVGYILSVFIGIKNPQIMNNEWEWMKAVSQWSPLDNIFFTRLYIFSVVSSIALGSGGLVLLKKFQKECTRASVT